jgi:hypothetical protein
MQEVLEALEAERTGLQLLVRELLVENQTLRQTIAKFHGPGLKASESSAPASPQPLRLDH